MGFSDTFPFLHPVARQRNRKKVISDTASKCEPLLERLTAIAESPKSPFPDTPMAAAGAAAGLQPVLDALPDPLLLLRPERGAGGTIRDFICTYANGAACRFHGHPLDRIVGARLLDLHPSPRSSGLFAHGVRALEAGQSVEVPATGRPGEAPAAPGTLRLFPAGGWLCCHWSGASEPADLRRQLSELDHSQRHDAITGLAVRSLTLARIRQALDRQAGTGAILAVLSIGVDGLTPVNDALTHAGGDQLIAFLAGRIVRAIGEPDRVGRGTGDEFIVLLSDLTSAAEAAQMAERILVACRAPITIGGQPIDPTVSIGIATTAAGALPDELLRDASLAMRQAKARGRNCFALLDNALATEAHTRLLFAAEIQRGLVMEEFAAWFMPIVSFASGEVTGYEALARWVRPDGLEVGPAEFLPCAERRGLIVRIDRLVLRQALATLSRLPDGLTMAVNVSAASLAQPDVAQLVAGALEAAGVGPERLHLEVTETALLSVTERIRQQMEQLAGLGVRWYVDDFGTGYSSISHLRDLPIAGLKLDRSFTCAMRSKDTKSLRLSQALVGVAEGLELDTVAEGVETIDEARLLTSQGWLRGQGWLYGKAAPLAP